ncbi:MAG: dTDP-glucose 4,6-dehydratase [Pirellulaceae bacterium]|nr:dTDP-glucose 4,6-dehydratase [Pirellulaceae bacterium]
MKILVTGGCGFIGVNLIRQLLKESEHEIVNLDKLTYAGNPQSLADIADNDRYQFVQADIANRSQMQEWIPKISPDAVIHLAAESHVDRSIDGPADFIQTNVVGTFHLLECCRDHYQNLSGSRRDDFRFLHVSTDEVFGSLGDTGRFTETTPYAPHSPYSASKAASDHLVRAWYSTYGLPVIVTNCSNNFGPYQFPEKFVPLMIIKCIHEQPLPVYGDGTNIRDWLFVDDHAAALRLVAERGVPGETYNVGGDNERRNIDMVHSLCNIMDNLRPRSSGQPYADLITYVADRPGHDFRYAIDSSKIHRQLGWTPSHAFDENLQRTIDWYLQHQSWWQNIIDGSYQLQRLGQTTDGSGANGSGAK